jgi:hypothetical protein
MLARRAQFVGQRWGQQVLRQRAKKMSSNPRQVNNSWLTILMPPVIMLAASHHLPIRCEHIMSAPQGSQDKSGVIQQVLWQRIVHFMTHF